MTEAATPATGGDTSLLAAHGRGHIVGQSQQPGPSLRVVTGPATDGSGDAANLVGAGGGARVAVRVRSFLDVPVFTGSAKLTTGASYRSMTGSPIRSARNSPRSMRRSSFASMGGGLGTSPRNGSGSIHSLLSRHSAVTPRNAVDPESPPRPAFTTKERDAAVSASLAFAPSRTLCRPGSGGDAPVLTRDSANSFFAAAAALATAPSFVKALMSDGYGRLWQTRWTKNSRERQVRVRKLRKQAEENPDEFDLELYAARRCVARDVACVPSRRCTWAPCTQLF